MARALAARGTATPNRAYAQVRGTSPAGTDCDVERDLARCATTATCCSHRA